MVNEFEEFTWGWARENDDEKAAKNYQSEDGFYERLVKFGKF